MQACPEQSALTTEDGYRKIRRRRLIRLIQVANLLLLFVLLPLYTIHAVQHQQQPVYGWVEGTAVESWARAVAPYLMMQQEKLHDVPLTAHEREAVAPIVARMQSVQPTHAVLLADGRTLYGKLSQETQAGEAAYTLTAYEGRRFQRHAFPADQLLRQHRLVFPQAELQARDLRFLLSHHAYGDAWFLAPYLFVFDGDFAPVFSAYTSMLMLQAQIEQEFAPLVEPATGREHLHVCILPDRHAYIETVRATGDAGLINSSGHFRRSGRRLYLFQNHSSLHMIGPKEHGEQRVLRHETAHLLAVTLGIFPETQLVPFWLEEGFAQYFEAGEPGALDAYKLSILNQAREGGSLYAWHEIMELDAEPPERTTAAGNALAYAQAWWIFRYLMQPHVRPSFLSWLAARQQAASGSAALDPHIDLMNKLRTTTSKFTGDLEISLSHAATIGEKSAEQMSK